MKKKQTELSKRIEAFIEDIESTEEYAVVSAKSDIAILIYARMEKCNVSRAELSRRLGKSRAYVSKMLGGGTNMTIETLVGIARVLDCHFSEFIPRPPQTANKKVAKAKVAIRESASSETAPRQKDTTQTAATWRKVSPRTKETAKKKVAA